MSWRIVNINLSDLHLSHVPQHTEDDKASYEAGSTVDGAEEDLNCIKVAML